MRHIDQKLRTFVRLPIWAFRGLMWLLSGLIVFIGIILRIKKVQKEKKIAEESVLEPYYPQDLFLKKYLFPVIPQYITPTYFTVVRIAVSPFIAYLVIHLDNLAIVLAAFVLIAMTDMVDGSLARVRNQVSNTGKLLDPVADKILILSTIWFLMPKFGFETLMWGIIGVEALTLVIGGIAALRKNKLGANLFGKLKMNFQILGTAFLLIHNLYPRDLFLVLIEAIFWIAIGFNILSMFAHNRLFQRLIRSEVKSL